MPRSMKGEIGQKIIRSMRFTTPMDYLYRIRFDLGTFRSQI